MELKMKYLFTAKSFCLGNGSKKDCDTCQHNKVWHELNELPDPSRLAKQKLLQRITDDQCMLVQSQYLPVETNANPQ